MLNSPIFSFPSYAPKVNFSASRQMRIEAMSKKHLLQNLPFLLFALLPLCGCHRLSHNAEPPVILAPDIVVLGAKISPPSDSVVLKLAGLVDQYHDATDGKIGTPPDLVQAKLIRNRFLFDVMAEIDLRYDRWEARFSNSRATGETIADAATLGLTAATAVVGTAGIKDLLAAAGTAASGTRLSVEKNFFNEQSTTALFTQMRASRGVIEAEIITRSAAPVTEYSIEQAWRDIIRYANAGTVQTALVQISASATAQNNKAQASVATAVENTMPVSAADVVTAQSVAHIRALLAAAIQPPPGTPVDRTKADAAGAAIRTILTTVDASPPEGASNEVLLGLLMTQMSAALPNPAKKKALAAAMQAAPKAFGGTQ